MLEALTQCEPDMLSCLSSSSLAVDILSILSDLYDRELVGTIGWAKQIPGLFLSLCILNLKVFNQGSPRTNFPLSLKKKTKTLPKFNKFPCLRFVLFDEILCRETFSLNAGC